MSTCPIYQKRGDQLVPVLVIDEAPSSDPSAAGHLVDSNGIASVVQELREEISELQPDVPTIVESVDSITEEDHDGFYWAFDETGAHRVPESNANFPVGSIVYTAMKAAPHGFLICDGSEVGRTTYPDLFTAIGTTYGAGDGTTTFNLPNLMNKTVWGGGLSAVGGEKAAGLPEIKGRFSVAHATGGDASGCFKTSDKEAANYDAVISAKSFYVDFSAARSNPIYGASDTVQPPALVLLPCIKAFEAVVNGGMVDVGELIKSIDALKDVAGGSSNEITNIVQNLGNYLPLAGGKLTGTLQVRSRTSGTNSSEPISILGTDSSKEICICTDPLDPHKGPFFVLYGGNCTRVQDEGGEVEDVPEHAGAFSIGARLPNPSDDSKPILYQLQGYPDGRLLWGGKPVDCVHSTDGRFWIRYTSGIQICWGWVHGTSGTTISYPVKFKADVDVPRVVLTPSYNSLSLTKERGLNLFTWLKQIPDGDGFIIARGTEISDVDYYFMYIAIGHWK